MAFFGILLLVVGAVGFRFAEGITRFNEQMDAIGSTSRARDVEPAEWNVLLTRLTLAGLALLERYLIVTNVL